MQLLNHEMMRLQQFSVIWNVTWEINDIGNNFLIFILVQTIKLLFIFLLFSTLFFAKNKWIKMKQLRVFSTLISYYFLLKKML